MSNVGRRTQKEFEADFPLDFGSGVRGDFVRHRNKLAGVIVAHMHNDGNICAGSVFWVKIEDRPVWKLESLEPLHLEPSIESDCGLHGHIRGGKWERAEDSI